MTSLITAEQAQTFARAWFHALDVHAAPQECLKLLAADGLRMHFPEGDLHEVSGFLLWYDRVVNVFFDERHTINNVDVESADLHSASINLRVRWQSVFWEPPSSASKHIDLEVSQKWLVRRCQPGKNPFDLEIVEYIVSDDIAYAPDSATLSPSSSTADNDLIALNHRIAEMEQTAGEEARAFFESLLSDRLVFRRASGKTVGKSGTDGFMATLPKNPFSSRQSEDITVFHVGDRALVTLIVAGTRSDDGSVHRFRNIRLFTRSADSWVLEFWYNYEVTGLQRQNW